MLIGFEFTELLDLMPNLEKVSKSSAMSNRISAYGPTSYDQYTWSTLLGPLKVNKPIFGHTIVVSSSSSQQCVPYL